jgi:hypothetical protein
MPTESNWDRAVIARLAAIAVATVLTTALGGCASTPGAVPSYPTPRSPWIATSSGKIMFEELRGRLWLLEPDASARFVLEDTPAAPVSVEQNWRLPTGTVLLIRPQTGGCEQTYVVLIGYAGAPPSVSKLGFCASRFTAEGQDNQGTLVIREALADGSSQLWRIRHDTGVMAWTPRPPAAGRTAPSSRRPATTPLRGAASPIAPKTTPKGAPPARPKIPQRSTPLSKTTPTSRTSKTRKSGDAPAIPIPSAPTKR